jgi:hypothetical protein
MAVDSAAEDLQKKKNRTHASINFSMRRLGNRAAE